MLTNTASLEEIVFNVGPANRAFSYGETLYAAGRFQEAHAAFEYAELTAYTKQVRSAARMRRMYLERVMAALEQGKRPPKPPLTDRQKEDIAKAEAERREREAIAARRKAEELKEAARLQAETSRYKPLVPNPNPPERPLESSKLFK